MAGLNIGTPTGNQASTSTQNPQAAPAQTIGASSGSGGVQPGTASGVLQPIGVNLNNPALITVSLADSTPAQAQTSRQSAAKPVQHHINPALFIVPVALFLIALVVFWSIHRSAKNTTD